MTAAAVLAALAAGYLLGRWQPARRASSWAHWLPYQRPAITWRDLRWWLAQPVYACEIAVLLLTRPRRTIHAWRHRHTPPPPRSAPVRVRDLTADEGVQR